MANPSQNRNSNRSRSNKISVTIGGLISSVDRTALAKSDGWTKHHGLIDGFKVNSLSSKTLGDSTILKTDDGRMASFDTNELKIFAAQFARDAGFTVSAPNGSNIDGGHLA